MAFDRDATKDAAASPQPPDDTARLSRGNLIGSFETLVLGSGVIHLLSNDRSRQHHLVLQAYRPVGMMRGDSARAVRDYSRFHKPNPCKPYVQTMDGGSRIASDLVIT